MVELIRLDVDILVFLFNDEGEENSLLLIVDFLFEYDDFVDSNRFFGILLAQDCNKALASIFIIKKKEKKRKIALKYNNKEKNIFFSSVHVYFILFYFN